VRPLRCAALRCAALHCAAALHGCAPHLRKGPRVARSGARSRKLLQARLQLVRLFKIEAADLPQLQQQHAQRAGAAGICGGRG
jgi:hypothetical protein